MQTDSQVRYTLKSKQSPSPKQVLAFEKIKFADAHSHQNLQEQHLEQEKSSHKSEQLNFPKQRALTQTTKNQKKNSVNIAQLKASFQNQRTESHDVDLLNQRNAAPNNESVQSSQKLKKNNELMHSEYLAQNRSREEAALLDRRNSNSSIATGNANQNVGQGLQTLQSNGHESQLNVSNILKKIKQSPNIKKGNKQFPNDFFANQFLSQPSAGSPLSNYNLQLSSKNGSHWQGQQFESIQENSPNNDQEILKQSQLSSKPKRFKFPVVMNVDDLDTQREQRPSSNLKITSAAERVFKSPSSNEKLKKLLSQDQENLNTLSNKDQHFDGLKTQMLNLSLDSDKIKKYGLHAAVKNAVANANLSEKRSRRKGLQDLHSASKKSRTKAYTNSEQESTTQEGGRNMSATDSQHKASRFQVHKHIRDDHSRNLKIRVNHSNQTQNSQVSKRNYESNNLLKPTQKINQGLLLPELTASYNKIAQGSDLGEILQELNAGSIPNLSESQNLQVSWNQKGGFEGKRVPVFIRRSLQKEQLTQEYYTGQNQHSRIETFQNTESDSRIYLTEDVSNLHLAEVLQKSRYQNSDQKPVFSQADVSPQSSSQTQNDVSSSQVHSNGRYSLNSSTFLQTNQNHHHSQQHHYWSRSPQNQRDSETTQSNQTMVMPQSTRNINLNRSPLNFNLNSEEKLVKFPNIFNHGGAQLNDSSLLNSQINISNLNLSQLQNNFKSIHKQGKVAVDHNYQVIKNQTQNTSQLNQSPSPIQPKTISYTSKLQRGSPCKDAVIQEQRETSESDNSFAQYGERNQYQAEDYMDLGDDDDEEGDQQLYLGLDRENCSPGENQGNRRATQGRLDRRMLTSRDQSQRWVKDQESNREKQTLGRMKSRSNLERNDKRDLEAKEPGLQGQIQKKQGKQNKLDKRIQFSQSGICFYNKPSSHNTTSSQLQDTTNGTNAELQRSPEPILQKQVKRLHQQQVNADQKLKSSFAKQAQKQQKCFKSEEFQSSRQRASSKLKLQNKPRYSLPENDSNLAQYEQMIDNNQNQAQRTHTREKLRRSSKRISMEKESGRLSLRNSEGRENLKYFEESNVKGFIDQTETPCFKQFEKSFKSSVLQTERASKLGQSLALRDLDTNAVRGQEEQQTFRKSIKESYLNYKTQLALNNPQIREIQNQDVAPFEFNPNGDTIFDNHNSPTTHERAGVYEGSTVKSQGQDMRDPVGKVQSLHLVQSLPAHYDNPQIKASHSQIQLVERVSLRGNVETTQLGTRSQETSAIRLNEKEPRKLKVISKSKFQPKEALNPTLLESNPQIKQEQIIKIERKKERAEFQMANKMPSQNEQQEQTQNAGRESIGETSPSGGVSRIKEGNGSNALLQPSHSQPQLAKKILLIKKSQIQGANSAQQTEGPLARVNIVKANSNKALNSNSHKEQTLSGNCSDAQLLNQQSTKFKIQQSQQSQQQQSQQDYSQNQQFAQTYKVNNEHVQNESRIQIENQSYQLNIYNSQHMNTSYFPNGNGQDPKLRRQPLQELENSNSLKSNSFKVKSQDSNSASFNQKQNYFTAKSSQEYDQVTPSFNTKHPSITQQINQIYMAAHIPQEFNGMITFMNIQQPSQQSQDNNSAGDPDAFHNTGGSLMRATILSLTTTSINNNNENGALGSSIGSNQGNNQSSNSLKNNRDHQQNTQSQQQDLSNRFQNAAQNSNSSNFHIQSNVGNSIVVIKSEGSYQQNDANKGGQQYQNPLQTTQHVVILQQSINNNPNTQQQQNQDLAQQERQRFNTQAQPQFNQQSQSESNSLQRGKSKVKRVKLKRSQDRDQNKENQISGANTGRNLQMELKNQQIDFKVPQDLNFQSQSPQSQQRFFKIPTRIQKQSDKALEQ